MSTEEKLSFNVVYGTAETEVLSGSTLLEVQLQAHKRAAKKRTIVLSIKPIL